MMPAQLQPFRPLRSAAAEAMSLQRSAAARARARTVIVPALELPDAEAEPPRLTHAFLDVVAAHVRTYRAKDLRTFARAWSCFCLFPDRFPAPRGTLRTRRVELALARLGVVDPRGGVVDGVPF